MWCHLPTSIRRRQVLLFAGLTSLIVALITTLMFAHAAHAVASTTRTISFQGRLLNSTGGVVADGTYNMRFKIYQDGDGKTANNSTGSPASSLKWTEIYTNNGGASGIEVKNGFFSVNLGSKTSFGSSIDWGSDTLWLSMDVAGNSSACSNFDDCQPDGEMLPMKRITAAPFAINSSQLGGKTADNFIQLAQGVQTDTSTNTSSIFINKTGSGNLLQLQSSTTDIFTVGNTGSLTLGSNADKSIQVATAANGTAGKNLSLVAGGGGSGSGSTGGSLMLQGGAAGGTNGNGGDIHIDAGVKSGSGSDGTVAIGTTTASSITFGRSSGDTAIAINGSTSVAHGDLMVISPDESKSVGLTWNGGNSTATLKTTGDTLALQGGGVNLLTTVNNGGVANVGIGNAAGNGYALDVTGDTNTSSQYLINGSSALTSSALSFSGSGDSTVTAASGEILSLRGDRVQIGTGSGSGQPTLLTVDKAASAPTVTDTEAALGSMYYDTTAGKLQCFEASGWGACDSSPDNFVTLSPEYANAVMHSTDTGSFTSDICSGSGSLSINTGVCDTNETYNFYKWTSPEVTDQTHSIFVTYQLPANFKEFVTDSTSLMGRTDSADSTVTYQIYRNTPGSSLAACGSPINVSNGTQTTWLKADASDTDDPASCSFAPGDSVVFRINLTTKNGANAYVSNLNFAFSTE